MHTSSSSGPSTGSSQIAAITGERWCAGKRLVLVADLIQEIAKRRAQPPWDAASELLDHLASLDEPLQLYGAPDGAEAKPVPGDFLWREGRAPQSQRLAFRRSFVVGVRSRLLPAVPEVAELRGLAGLRVLLQGAASKAGGLHKALQLKLPGFAGPLALTLEDAEAMLLDFLSAPNVAGVVQIESADARRLRERHELAAAEEQCGPPAGFQKGARRTWTDEALLKLLADYERLVPVCGNADDALKHLHEIWDYSYKPDKKGGQLADQLTAARRLKTPPMNMRKAGQLGAGSA